MKKLFYLLAVVMLISCNSNGESKPDKGNLNKATTSVSGKVQHLNKAEYQKLVYDFEANPQNYVYNGKLPAIVDFYADWCGPCKRVAPILDKLAEKYAGKINIYKVNVDNEQELAGAHGIQSIPTMIFYPMNGNPQIVQGALPEEKIEEAIQQILLKTK